MLGRDTYYRPIILLDYSKADVSKVFLWKVFNIYVNSIKLKINRML